MPSILCEHCTAACCRYIALPLDAPETPADFEDIRWFLMHEHVSVFVEDGDWYVAFQTPCRHLQPDHRCGVYRTRPKICRTYTTDDCDYHSGDYNWEQHFTAPEHLDAYQREQPANGRSRGRRGSGNGKRKRRLPAPGSNGHAQDRCGTALPILLASQRP
jgi:Fe-S-cluster containining protein